MKRSRCSVHTHNTEQLRFERSMQTGKGIMERDTKELSKEDQQDSSYIVDNFTTQKAAMK